MAANSILVFLFAATLLQTAERFEVSTPDITQSRKMVGYDQGGSLDCRGVTKPFEDPQVTYKRLSANLQLAREFILGHFQRREKGYIRLTMNSVDATATSHIFIEPDEKDSSGGWRIAWRIARAGRHHIVDDVPVIKSLQALKTDRGMKLNFLDSDGKTVESLGAPYVIGYSYPD